MKVCRPVALILTVKLVVKATSFERSEKEGLINNLQPNTYHSGENLVKSGLADPDIKG